MVAMSAQQIYDNFAQAAGTGAWLPGQDAAKELADNMKDLAADIWRLRTTMQSAWQGDAADQAGTGAEPLAMEFLNSADYLGSSQDLISRQVGSFHTAANSVQPVPSPPSAVDVIGAAAFGIPSMQHKVQNYLDTSQHNVDVFDSYHGASQYNTTNIPATYGRIALDKADVVVVTPQAASSTPPAGGGSVAAPANHQAPSGESVTRPSAPTPGGPGVTRLSRADVLVRAPVARHAAAGTADTGPSGVDGGPGSTVASGVGVAPGVGGSGGGSRIRDVLGGGSAGGRGDGSGLGLPGVGAPSVGGFGDGVGGVGGRGVVGDDAGLSGGVSRVGGGAVEGSPGRAGSGGDLAGRGGSVGDVAGRGGSGGDLAGRGGSAGDVAGRGGSGGDAAGRGGSGGDLAGRGGSGGDVAGRGGSVGEASGEAGEGGGSLGPLGGRGGRGERDGERRLPHYLKEPDPEGVFGIDTAVAPPVIGE